MLTCINICDLTPTNWTICHFGVNRIDRSIIYSHIWSQQPTTSEKVDGIISVHHRLFCLKDIHLHAILLMVVYNYVLFSVRMITWLTKHIMYYVISHGWRFLWLCPNRDISFFSKRSYFEKHYYFACINAFRHIGWMYVLTKTYKQMHVYI